MWHEVVTATGAHIKDITGGAGVLVSLGLGVRNWRTTTKLRTGTIRLEEFRSQIRDPIVATLGDIKGVKEAIFALGKPNGLSDDELSEKVSAQLAKLEFYVLDLEELFKHADRSEFVRTDLWESAFEVPLQNAQRELDTLVSRVPLDRNAVPATLAGVVQLLSDTTRDIKLRLEQEVQATMPG